MNRLVIVSVVALGLAAESRAEDAAHPRMIPWDVLKAPRELFIDPFAKLSPKQLSDVGYVRRVRWLIAEDKLSDKSNDATKAHQLVSRMTKEGVDVDSLIQQRERIRDLRNEQLQSYASSVVRKLHGQQVVLNGFAVPISGNAKGEAEFFLVPSIDFCNSSAPPSTQVIYVRGSKSPAVNGRTTPLQVIGTLEQRTTKRSFVFPGQTLHFESDYAIEPTEIKIIDWRTDHKPSM